MRAWLWSRTIEALVSKTKVLFSAHRISTTLEDHLPAVMSIL